MKQSVKMLSCALAGCTFLSLAAACTPKGSKKCEVAELTASYVRDPLGLDEKPLFGWTMKDDTRGQRQTAYRIRVASSAEKLSAGEGDVWDSGKQEASGSVAVPYGGNALSAATRYYWTVSVWDKDGKEVAAKEPAYFETGVGKDGFSDAAWIQAQGAGVSAPMLRREFEVQGSVKSARVYATSAGVYDLYLNGEKVGDAFLTPSWTEYDRRVMYQTYDVTDLIKEGGNAIGAQLGNGWYIGGISSYGGTAPAFLCKAVITYENGTVETLVTDNSWQGYRNGPVTMNDIYNGETYDARKEVSGWNEAGFDASAWGQALPTTAEKLGMGEIVSQVSGSIKAMEEREAISVNSVGSGKYVYDFGQNFSGVVELTLSGEAGQQITLRHGEMLNDTTGTGDGAPGTLYTANLRTARNTDTYILGETGKVVSWYPTLTYHGFRYLEVSGLDEALPLENVRAKVLYSELESTMEFDTSNGLINQLASNALWGQKSNFLSVPTDCPQRDERMGWTGDAQIFSGTAAYNMNVKTFFDDYIDALNDCQTQEGERPNVNGVSQAGAYPDVAPGRKSKYNLEWPTPGSGNGGWGDAGVIIPYTMYTRYGDASMIVKYWENMKAYIDFLVRDAGEDFIRDGRKLYGDWLANEPALVEVTNTAWCVYACDLMAEMAYIIGETADAMRFEGYARSFREAWCNKYLEADGTIKHYSEKVDLWGGGEWEDYYYDTQTTYVLGLYFGIIPDDRAEGAAAALVEKIAANGYKLSTGFAGTSYLLPVLCEYGYEDVAFTLLEQEENPSWLFPVLQGATTIWERWDSYTKENGFTQDDMNSFNHYSYGSVMEWVYSTVVGISCDKDAPAFKSFVLKPTYGGSFSYAEGSYTSAYGVISSGWKLLKGGKLEYTCTVPANTQAVLYLPAAEGDKVTESGKNALKNKADGVTYLGYENGRHVFRVEAGTYTFGTAAH